MATRLNNNLSFNTGWALEYLDLTAKELEAVHDENIISTRYTFEKQILQQSGATYYGSATDPGGTTRFGTVGV